MHSEVRHVDKLTNENYNCVRCGYVYKSITTIRTAHSSTVIQIMECNRCGYRKKLGNNLVPILTNHPNDKLNDCDGEDLIVCSYGNDELTGGKGTDKFECGIETDTITDFIPPEGGNKTNDCEQF